MSRSDAYGEYGQYAVLKEVKEIRLYQLLAYPHNQIALRIESKEGTSKQQVSRWQSKC